VKGLVWVAAVLALAGCSTKVSLGDDGGPGGNPAEAKYGEIALHKDNGSERPGGNVDAFQSHEKVIHMSCSVDRKLKDVTTTWTLTGVKTTEGENLEILSLDEQVTGEGFTAMFKVPHIWPVGTYRIDLKINGKPVASRDFEIGSDGLAHHEVAITELRLLQDLEGQAGKKVDFFRPADRRMHFEASTLGARDKATEVKWSFLKRDDSGDTLIHSVTTKMPIATNSVLTANLSLPRDWPVGKYVAAINLDGELAREFDYEVRAEP